MLWGMVHSFEIVAHYFLFAIDFPPNAAIMYKIMYDIANFSFIPTNIVFGPFYDVVGDLDLGLKTADEVAATQTGVDDHLM